MVADPFASAKTALRDNVKTVMAVFAGVAGVLLAGTPFTGFGTLPWGGRLGLAVLSLLAVVVLAAWGLRRLLATLQPDLVYPDVLRSDFDLGTIDDPVAREELQAVKREFERVKPTLLPMQHAPTFEAYQQLVDALGAQARKTGQPVHLERWRAHATRLEELSHWAAFTRLHVRVRRGLRDVLVLGLAALVAMLGFAWAVNAPKPDAAPTIVNIAAPAPPPAAMAAASAPAFEAVLFATGQSRVTGPAVDRVRAVRDYLQARPTLGVLVRGHTDTQGGDARNVELARQRVEAVAALLRAPGGLPASRVFVSAPGPADVPVLTGPQVDHAENRSVRFDVIELPSR